MDRQQRRFRLERHGLSSRKFRPTLRVLTSRKVFRYLLVVLAVIAILPPIYFHFRLRTFHQKLNPLLVVSLPYCYPKLRGLFTFDAAPDSILQKYTTIGESDTHPLTFLKSPSDIAVIY